jgi:hypothetical protein
MPVRGSGQPRKDTQPSAPVRRANRVEAATDEGDRERQAQAERLAREREARENRAE